MSNIDERTGKPKIILDLCGGSGSWSRAYVAAGYDVRNITLPQYDVLTYDPPDDVYGILAAPPCTEFSVLNCRAEARQRDPQAGLKIVMACMRIIEKCKPVWWALENPVGYLREYMGKSTLIFQPWQYGDPWTKRTEIWGTFTLPEARYKNGKMFQISSRFTPDRGGESRILRTFISRRRPSYHSLRGRTRKPTRIFEPLPRRDLHRRFLTQINRKEGVTVDKQQDSGVFTIPARRCKRCGGLLTSAQAIRDGYGSCCLRKMRQEARAKEEAKNQYSLFDGKEEP